MDPRNQELLTVADVARMLDLTPDGVRRLANRGDVPTMRTRSGQRLFLLPDVQRLIKQRANKPRTGRPRAKAK